MTIKLRKVKSWHIAFAVMVMLGLVAIIGPIVVILMPSKQPPRTPESIQRQIKYFELEIAELEARKGISPLTEADKKVMRLRGESEEKIQKLEDATEKTNKIFKEATEELIKTYQKKIEQLRK